MATERFFYRGTAGQIEVFVDQAASDHENSTRGIALVAHPHPLYGGTPADKVVQTMARSFVDAGYIALRPSFRGVGDTEGTHDHGDGETDDLLAVVEQARAFYGERLPLVLAGFSFGGFVQARVAQHLETHGVVPE